MAQPVVKGRETGQPDRRFCGNRLVELFRENLFLPPP